MLFRLIRPIYTCRLYANKYTYSPAILTFQPNTNNHQWRTHKNFGHKQEKTPLVSKIWYTFLIVAIIAGNLNYKG